MNPMARARAPAAPGPEALLAALGDPRRYPHPVERIELIETHISWVLLTGRYAYKLKKPLDLGFLDFSTLERRREACEKELRLNRRTAPDLYLEVVPVTGTPDEPVVGGSGLAIEYAVKMREFPQAALLDRAAARGELRLEQMDELASTVARFHAKVERADPQTEFGTPEAVIAPARQNFAQLRPLATDADAAAVLGRLAAWTDGESARCREAFDARRREGFVRECHGDLHLRNLVLLDGRIVPFDCLEFNDALRWIDVAAEVAFVVMDLVDHGLTSHAWRFLDAYLAETGDYGSLAVLRFYLVYRAMVRAKIACLRAQQLPEGVPQRRQADGEFREYLRLAEAFASLERRALIVTRGLSGSGKTVFSGLLTGRSGRSACGLMSNASACTDWLPTRGAAPASARGSMDQKRRVGRTPGCWRRRARCSRRDSPPPSTRRSLRVRTAMRSGRWRASSASLSRSPPARHRSGCCASGSQRVAAPAGTRRKPPSTSFRGSWSPPSRSQPRSGRSRL